MAGACCITAMSFGIGGIASLTRTDLPVEPELVLAEQLRQGASRGWLGRSFRDTALPNLTSEVERLRTAIARWQSASRCDWDVMKAKLRRQIDGRRGKPEILVSG